MIVFVQGFRYTVPGFDESNQGIVQSNEAAGDTVDSSDSVLPEAEELTEPELYTQTDLYYQQQITNKFLSYLLAIEVIFICIIFICVIWKFINNTLFKHSF